MDDFKGLEDLKEQLKNIENQLKGIDLSKVPKETLQHIEDIKAMINDPLGSVEIAKKYSA